MGIRSEYEVRKLPDDYTTFETAYEFVDDEKQPKDRYGNARKRMVSKQREVKGGWLFIVRGKPGHSFRLATLDQVEALKLSIKPRMIDTSTGEEVNEHGIPLHIAEELARNGATVASQRSAGGAIEVDVDVNSTGDEALGAEAPALVELGDAAGAEHVNATIDKLE